MNLDCPSAAPPSSRQRVTILGSTGSIGGQTLSIVAAHPEAFAVDVLVAHRHYALLAEQAILVGATEVVIVDSAYEAPLRHLLQGHTVKVSSGMQAACEAVRAAHSDRIVAAIQGVAGLPATMAALQTGAMVLLANKEALVCAGPLMMQAARAHGSLLLPLDSEHHAVFDLLHNNHISEVSQVFLTASGGPFLRHSPAMLRHVTVQDAIRHPVWSMGQKISVDSATMVNKALELMEAQQLFGLTSQQLSVLIHPESIIHAIVAYVDGNMAAHMAVPDMCIPIAHALTYPASRRAYQGVSCLEMMQRHSLHLEPPDLEQFPVLSLVRHVMQAEASVPVAFNAANEVAVAHFLQGNLPFTRIVPILEEAVATHTPRAVTCVEDVWEVDRAVREQVETLLRSHTMQRDAS